MDSGPQLTILPGDYAPAGYGVEPADLAPDGTGAEPEPVNDGFEWRINPKDCPHTQRLVRVGMPCVACGDTSDA
jgi:hypothetical protein